MKKIEKFLVLVLFLILFLDVNLSAANKLVFLTWSDYIDPEIVNEFQKAFNIEIKMEYFETDKDRDNKLSLTDGKGYDLVLITGSTISSYVNRKWITPLDFSQIPNIKNIDNKYLKAFPDTDKFGVPYTWGTVGIAYRKDLVKEKILSWMQLYKPQEGFKKRIMMINDPDDVIGLAFKALGYSINSSDDKALSEAEKLLIAQKPYVQSYSYIVLSEKSSLVTGDTFMAMTYNGDAVALKKYNPEIVFVVPKEGTYFWVDYLSILESSNNKKMAMEFINFINEPKRAAKTALFLNYATPNKEAKKLLPNEHLENQEIYPSEDILSKSEFIQKRPLPVLKKINSIFSKLK
ncbi:MAG: spermidine/putrescine ABC transporter substrate-binding protein [Desulfobacterales bacterium]|nr:spermidine/putrescine ABC transporter substrate-binding protein [Desulfobacterales bacterium]MBF0396664.1 spermidine/putrescine ABC transporter substrate-binding protein [Desulfobacterales bacterium]